MIQASGLTYLHAGGGGIKDLTFSRAGASLTGLIGPNGAGKTTIMRLLAGVLAPQQGHIQYFGLDFAEVALPCRAMIGYLPEGAPLPNELSGRQYLDFVATMSSVPKGERGDMIAGLARVINMDDFWHRPIATLSKGMRRRVALAGALINDPSIILLDEPMDGLDPIQKQAMRALLKDLAKEKIVIISTHALDDVAAICDQVLMVADGALKFDRPIEEFEMATQELPSDLAGQVILSNLNDAFLSLEPRTMHGDIHER